MANDHFGLSVTLSGDTALVGALGKASYTGAAYVYSIAPNPTSTSITSAPNPSTYGQTVKFTAKVSPAAATGTVTFKDGANTMGTDTLRSGKAAYSTASLRAGTHSITASYSGDANNTETTSRPLKKMVKKAGQTIAFCPPPAMIFGETKDGCATGGASGNPVIFSSLTKRVCTIKGSTVTGKKAGDCIIGANQAGNANYNPAPRATQTFTIGQVD